MKFKIVDNGPEAEVQYVSYAKKWSLFFPVWIILGGSNTEEKAKALCQDYYNSQHPQPEKVREFEIL